jgi:hypothetical protein
MRPANEEELHRLATAGGYGNHPVRVQPGSVEVLVETWTYNLGPTKLMQQVRIEGGYVVEVNALGYGHR